MVTVAGGVMNEPHLPQVQPQINKSMDNGLMTVVFF